MLDTDSRVSRRTAGFPSCAGIIFLIDDNCTVSRSMNCGRFALLITRPWRDCVRCATHRRGTWRALSEPRLRLRTSPQPPTGHTSGSDVRAVRAVVLDAHELTL